MSILHFYMSKAFFGATIVALTLTILSYNGYSQTAGKGLSGTNSPTQTQTLPVVPQPGITVALTNVNQLSIAITNGVSYANYELYHRPSLELAYPWRLSQVGAQGQTNFIVGISYDYEFLAVAAGSDWDQDGVPNSQDADPLNATIGALTVTINTPPTGSVVQ